MSLIEGCKHEIEIEVPLEEVQRETDHVVSHLQQRAKLQGFRPGKAPASLIRSKFKTEIRKDVLEHIVPKAFRAKADEEHWKIVGTPNVTEVKFEEGEPLRFKAQFEVSPEFELGEYRGIETPYADPHVSASDIDERIGQIREQKAQFVNEEPRPLADGDHAVIAIRSIAGVDPAFERDEMVLELGSSGTMPEFTENLRGMSPEEEKVFEVTYPEDYGQENLAGKTVTFEVKVKAVRRKELPELNDEFARDLGDFQTLEELRETVRKSLLAEREAVEVREAKNRVIDRLVDVHDFAVPDAFVEGQMQATLEQRLRELAAGGLDPRTLNVDWAKVRESYRGQAIRNVRASLILERIADAEAIHTTNDEVDREVQRIARQSREPIAAARIRLEKEGNLNRIAAGIRTEKVLNFLFENARKVPKPVEEKTEAPE